MPSLLLHTDCAVCGHRHHFGLPIGDIVAEREYRYLCPEVGTPGVLRPTTCGQWVNYYPQGAVQLESEAARRAAG